MAVQEVIKVNTDSARILRRELAKWEERFHGGMPLPVATLTRMKLAYASKYGWPALEQLVKEVESNSALVVIRKIELIRKRSERFKKAPGQPDLSAEKCYHVSIIEFPNQSAKKPREKEKKGRSVRYAALACH